MPFYADLHVHSKYSRATSKHADLEHLAFWARKKGIAVVATGDFTHPAWREEMREKLVPAEPGLFRLRPDVERRVMADLPGACQGPVRFLLSVEISTIYKKGERTRKVHHLVYAPDFGAVDRAVASLDKIGNLASDGRPILGLDSRDLLEITLESGPDSYLVPAHIWTPWFAAMGSKSGFDSIADCYGDLSGEIFAVETGLSSDPEMNWRVSSLDRYRLVSNSDAHSPEKLGREACAFETELDYFAMKRALETGEGYVGTVEFFPEEGKYHLDGHRACGVRLEPGETRARDGKCPVCGKPVTVGVMHRIHDLSDRDDGSKPATAAGVSSLVPLPELLGEILHTGPKSKRVAKQYDGLLSRLGPELDLLESVPLDEVRRVSSSLVAEAISRLREARVIREAGYDGEYGRIRLFEKEELAALTQAASLFDLGGIPEPEPAPPPPAAAPVAETSEPEQPEPPPPAPDPRASEGLLASLDEDQRRAAEVVEGPLLIVAGPGSGKTRTLTHRLAHLVAERGIAPERLLAITFTRRAADEMRERLARLLPEHGERVEVRTFHAFGLGLLKDERQAAGLQRGFAVADDADRAAAAAEALGLDEADAARQLEAISRAKRTGEPFEGLDGYERALEARNLVDLDDLVVRPAALIEADPEVRARCRERWPFVSVDEFQDVDAAELRLLAALVPPDGNLCAIGDPDQSIYGFRGAEPRSFERFQEARPGTRLVRLRRNYRSAGTIVTGSSQMLARGEPREAPLAAGGLPDCRIVIHEAPTERSEAEFVVKTLEVLLGGHNFFSIDSGRTTGEEVGELSFSDVAVLYRTDRQADALEEALVRSGLPFQRRSHRPLAEHAGVVALCRRVAEEGGEGAVSARIARVLADRTTIAAAPLHAAAELVRGPAETAGDDFDAFRRSLALEVQVDTWDPRAERISMLTLHASKGLEFPVVFLTGCEDGLLPQRFGSRLAAELDEERRLFYVGMTRAARILHLSRAKKREWQGRVREFEPSPFLRDIEERLLERREAELPQRRAAADEAQLELF